MQQSNATSPLLMAAIALPIFSSPLPGMMKIGLMFDHGNSIGGAFVLFLFGIGLCVGTLLWLVLDFGRRALPWFVAYFALAIAAAYLCNATLYDARKAEVEHTHAFDDYSNPFHSGDFADAKSVAAKWKEKFGVLEQTSAGILVGLGILGLAVRRSPGVEAWLTRPATRTSPRGKFDVAIPGPLLGAIAILGLFGFAVIGAFVYYPDRAYCFDRMAAVHADATIAIRTEKTSEAERHLEEWDLLVRKLEVGVYLREGRATAEQADAAVELREALETVRDAIRDGDQALARRTLDESVLPHYGRVKRAFAP